MIDLTQVPQPAIVEQKSIEGLIQERVDQLIALNPEYSALVESDPAIMLVEISAYQDYILRQRMNDIALGLLLPFAIGADLDQIGVTYYGVPRLIIEPGEEPVYESDESYRERIQLSLEGRTTAGPRLSYRYFALSTDSTESGGVKDVEVLTPNYVIDITGEKYAAIQQKLQLIVDEDSSALISPDEAALIQSTWYGQGHVYVYVMGRDGNGIPNQDLLDAVQAQLNAEDVRPLTDLVHVSGPTELFEYQIEADIYFYSGIDDDLVFEKIQNEIQSYVDSVHKLGFDVALSGIYSALHQTGVQRVAMIQPMDTITVQPTELAYCTSIQLNRRGTDE